MNFGREIKNEIISKPIKENCCKKAFLAGYIRGNGVITYDEDDNIGLSFSVFDEMTAIFIQNVFGEVFGKEITEVSVSNDRLNNRDKFSFSLSGEFSRGVLTSLGIIKTFENNDVVVNLRLFDGVADKDCCVRSFFRGLFISAGNCSVPSKAEGNKTGFHAELCFSHSAPASIVSEKLLSASIRTKITRRKDNYVVYIKSGEEIKDFVAFLGAPKMVLKLTDMIIDRELSNITNRQMNCDMGNVTRQIQATEKNINAINLIKEKIGLDALKDDLKQTAIYRIDYPDDTLSELADRLNITKSCLNHRLRKIISISKEI